MRSQGGAEEEQRIKGGAEEQRRRSSGGAEEEQKRSRGGAEEQRRSRGGAEEQRRSRRGAEEEQRSRGGAEEEQRRSRGAEEEQRSRGAGEQTRRFILTYKYMYMFSKFHSVIMVHRVHVFSRELNAIIDVKHDKQKCSSIIDEEGMDLVHCICDCVHNILQENIPVSEEERKKLKRHRECLRELVKKKTPYREKSDSYRRVDS